MLHPKIIQIERSQKPIMLFNSWLRDDAFNQAFCSAWATPIEGSPLFQLNHKLRMVKEAARNWSTKQGLMDSSIQETKAALQVAATWTQSNPHNVVIQQLIQELGSRFREL